MATMAAESTVFAMPSLGADMEEGRITEWLVKPGDEVKRGQIVVIVETEKSDIEVEVFQPGVIAELLVPEGDKVPVGTPIARIAPLGATVVAVAAPPIVVEQPTPEPMPEPKREPVAPEPGHITSPVIRHLAEQLHVDVAHVHGTGAGGRVRRDDVVGAAQPAAAPTVVRPTVIAASARRQSLTPRARRLIAERGLDPAAFAGQALVTGEHVLAYRAPAQAVPAAPATGGEPLSKADKMRRHIAELMTKSWREIPHYHVAKRLDVGDLVARLTTFNEQRSLAERIVPAAPLMCAMARAAKAVPACNGWWRGDRFEQAPAVNLGVVLSLRGGGIMVPTIEAADRLSLPEMMERLTELVLRTRQGRLRASDFAEASITVTNLGDLGADSVGPIIHPPQVVIVGFGTVHDEVWAIDGQPVVRPTVHASLAGDHRAIDGLAGSRFLAQVEAALSEQLWEGL
jgi:pyruvate dehydrogenase E2 component (dihydrolipoamide acetyltransferase)